MKKPKKVTNTAKSKKPSKAEAAQIGRDLASMMNQMQEMLREQLAVKRGMQMARAKLLAPTLALMQSTAATNGSSGPVRNAMLNPTDCALLLDCLAEAGYVPAMQSKPGVETHRTVRMPLAAPSPLDGVTDHPSENEYSLSSRRPVPPVAKAA